MKNNYSIRNFNMPIMPAKIGGAVKRLDGVDKDSVEVMFNASRVKLNFNEEDISIEEIEKAINQVGYEVVKSQVKDL